MKKKVLLLGHMRHGKDTVAEMLRDEFDYNFESSSMAAAKIFLYDELRDKYGYDSFEECYEDRMNHRAEWHDLICQYNTPDKARLAREIMANYDIYVGMRSGEECAACLEQGLFDLIIGVFDPRKELEGRGSFNINLWETAHIIIPNAEGLPELRQRVLRLKPLLT